MSEIAIDDVGRVEMEDSKLLGDGNRVGELRLNTIRITFDAMAETFYDDGSTDGRCVSWTIMDLYSIAMN